MSAKCPECKWRMPILGEHKRNPNNQFDCPSCSTSLVYRHTLGAFTPLMWASYVPLLLWFSQLPEGSWQKLLVIGIAALNVPLMFSLERLERAVQENSDA